MTDMLRGLEFVAQAALVYFFVMGGYVLATLLFFLAIGLGLLSSYYRRTR